MQSVSKNPLMATFQLSSAVSLNLGRSQNGVLGIGLTPFEMKNLRPVQIVAFADDNNIKYGRKEKLIRICLFRGFTPYECYCSYLKATVHKSMFPGQFLTST